MKRIIVFLAVLSIAVLLYGISQIQEVHKTFDVKKNTELNLLNINGSIKIEGWDKDYVDFLATKKTNKGSEELDKVDIVFDQENGLSIETEYLTKNPKVSVSFELSVPRSLLLKSIRSSNGSITIENAGEVEVVRTSNGSVSIEDCAGKIEVNTSNGSITADNIEGSINANTSNARINLENINGMTNAKTSNGSINIINVAAIQNAKTSNGSIKAHILQVPADLELKSSNGSISVYLDNDLDAEINASTSNGKVRLHDYPVMASDTSGTYLAGYVGNGGNLLKLRTSNASIHIYDDNNIEF